VRIYNTPTINDKKFEAISMITDDIVVGVNVIRDIFATFRDFFGGRSKSYEDSISEAKRDAVDKLIAQANSLRADAIIGVTFNIFTVGHGNSMVCVSITGTAVKFVA
jgi:uncharacterized protein YbjQ (UPF0145 family)